MPFASQFDRLTRDRLPWHNACGESLVVGRLAAVHQGGFPQKANTLVDGCKSFEEMA